MALLNPPGILPHALWALIRYLSTQKGLVTLDGAQGMLSPAALSPNASDDVFKFALTALIDLGLVEQVHGDDRAAMLRHRSHVPAGSRESFRMFAKRLRSAVMSQEHNEGLGADSSQVGPRDLVRALCWFLSLDPLGDPVNVDTFENRQVTEHPLPAAAGVPFSNKTRWNAFLMWCPALGLGQQSLLPPKGNERALVPDATIAVQDVITEFWVPGETVATRTLVQRVRQALPVLPGGPLSLSLGLQPPGDRVDPVLSWALLRGQQDGWLNLQSQSDSADPELLTDPDRPDGLVHTSSIVIGETDHE